MKPLRFDDAVGIVLTQQPQGKAAHDIYTLVVRTCIGSGKTKELTDVMATASGAQYITTMELTPWIYHSMLVLMNTKLILVRRNLYSSYFHTKKTRAPTLE